MQKETTENFTKYYHEYCKYMTITDAAQMAMKKLSEEATITRATPKHYENGKGYDVIDIIKDYDLNFNLGNSLKYICRSGKKENQIQDLKKAIDYLQREIEYLEKNR